MRTFRLIGMALLAVVVGVGFIACGDDEEDEIIKDDNGIVTNQKKLREIKYTHDDSYNDSYGGGSTFTFLYDGEGRLTTAIKEYNNDDEEEEITRYFWDNNTITYNYGTYTLSDNLLREVDSRQLTYNSSKQLSRADLEYLYGGGSSDIYTWDGDKLVKYVEENRDSDGETNTYNYEYVYNGETCNGWFPNIEDESWNNVFEEEYVCYAHPELVGMRSNQLPAQILYKRIYKDEFYDERYQEVCKYESTSEGTWKLEYTLDKDRYVESCVMKYKEMTTTIYSFQDKNYDGVISDDERNVIEARITGDESITYNFTWE